MRKIKSFFALFLCGLMMLTFSACKKETTMAAPDLNKLFTVTASVQYGDFNAAATVNRLGNDMWDVEFSEPSTLAGVKLSYNGEDITASYLGLSFSVPKNAAPVKSMLNMLFKAIDKSAMGLDMPCTEEDGIMTFSGTGDFGDFTLSMEKSTGNLVSFELPDEKLQVQFADFAPIQ